MTSTSDAMRRTNPFATRWVRPGALRYLFVGGMNLQRLIERLRSSGWLGAIVGPHGSGKSTLLFDLIPVAERLGIRVRRIALHDGQRSLPVRDLRELVGNVGDQSVSSQRCEALPTGLLLIDGYEQLGRWARWRLSIVCRRQRCGLLVTAHCESSLGRIPILFRTAADLTTVQHLVGHVLPAHGGLIGPDDVAAAFESHLGNVRETMFALYDLFEQRRL